MSSKVIFYHLRDDGAGKGCSQGRLALTNIFPKSNFDKEKRPEWSRVLQSGTVLYFRQLIIFHQLRVCVKHTPDVLNSMVYWLHKLLICLLKIKSCLPQTATIVRQYHVVIVNVRLDTITITHLNICAFIEQDKKQY
jgi:hypothetical protein